MSDNIHTITASVTGKEIFCKDSNDAKVTIYGDGPNALDLMLMSVAGCSGATLRAMFKRDGLKPERFELSVEGQRSDARPPRFTDVTVNYDIACEDLTEDRLKRYLDITERMCPAVQSLNSNVTYTFKLNA